MATAHLSRPLGLVVLSALWPPSRRLVPSSGRSWLDTSFKEVKRKANVIGRFPTETSALMVVCGVLKEERLKWQKVGMRADDIAWIEEAANALEQEPIELDS